jgi:RNA recognition motif-containing protein
VTEMKVERFFQDCGTINNILLVPEGNTTTATIEFETIEDVLAAQTRDSKSFEGHAIQVQGGSGCTVWVTNFPPIADERYIRDLFKDCGEIIDVRFPSLKFASNRRFCYVQFKMAEQAFSATALSGTDLGDGHKLVAKL